MSLSPNFSLILRSTLLAAAAAVSLGAQAQGTWNLVDVGSSGGQCTQQGTNSGTFDNAYGCANGGRNVTISSWSSDRGTGGNAQAAGTGSNFANAHLSNQGTAGFGSKNRTEGLGVGSPDHAFDSIAPGTMDLMLLDFGSTNVVLSQIGLGWKSGTGAGDITVMRWVGTKPAFGTAAVTVGGSDTLSATTCTGGVVTGCWSLVGSYDDLATDGSNPYGQNAVSTGAAASTASSWWMISTFNSAFNNNSHTCIGGDGTCTSGNDSFKINFINTTVSQVPVPGSLALAGLGLLAAFAARRRIAA